MFEQYHRHHGIAYKNPLTGKDSDTPLVIFQTPFSEQDIFSVTPQSLVLIYQAVSKFDKITLPKGLLFTLEKGLREAWKASGKSTLDNWDDTIKTILKQGFEEEQPKKPDTPIAPAPELQNVARLG